MSYETLLVEHEGPISWITLNRPQRLNAMNDQLLGEFSAALAQLRDDGGPVLGIRGQGRAFSSGYDIENDSEEMTGAADRDITDDHNRLEGNIKRFLEIWDHPKPVIAAVHGYCLAGATQLCMFTDITIVAEDARIGLPALPMGGGYITPLWTPFVGPKRAKQMSFVPSSQIDGKTAEQWGWANYAVPADELMDNVRELAAKIATIPSPILRVKKMAINRVWDVMGFRNTVLMGAESDALLHASRPVKALSNLIAEHGLKGAIARYNAGSWDPASG
jgi:enoyl-CoA hydratase/carnithine racemase